MQNEMTLDRVTALYGADVYDSAGDKIGTVEEIFYDEQPNRPEWIGIRTGFFKTKRGERSVTRSTFTHGSHACAAKAAQKLRP
jgi:sporulation protein YlmC with PRC-barrel domain